MKDEYDSTNMKSAEPNEIALKNDIHLETSTVPWHELQRLFAAGVVIAVANDLDLVEVACLMAEDNKREIESLMVQNKIQHVNNEQAKTWYANNTLLWSVVVKPWVLVQDR